MLKFNFQIISSALRHSNMKVLENNFFEYESLCQIHLICNLPFGTLIQGTQIVAQSGNNASTTILKTSVFRRYLSFNKISL